MALCGESTIWAKIALILIFIACMLHITGFSTWAWSVYKTENYTAEVGLWALRNCTATLCSHTALTLSDGSASLNGGRAFECMGLITILVTTVLLCLYVVLDEARKQKMAIATMALSLISVFTLLIWCAEFSVVFTKTNLNTIAFLIMIGVIIMAASTVDPWYSYWSLGLCALGAVLCVIGAIVLVPEVRENMD